MIFVIIALWIGSVSFGFIGNWFWLIVPPVVFGLHAWRVSAQMQAVRRKMGLSKDRKQIPGPSIASANAELIVWTSIQHLALFLVGYGLKWLIG